MESCQRNRNNPVIRIVTVIISLMLSAVLSGQAVTAEQYNMIFLAGGGIINTYGLFFTQHRSVISQALHHAGIQARI